MATTGFQAGVETNDVELSYALEAAWGTLPAVAFQAVRVMSESFSGSKTRTRPSEIRNDFQASTAITTQEQATAGLNFGLSYGTFDDFLAGLFQSTWQTTLAISGTDIAATSGGLSSATAGKFSNIQAGQWIKIAGFSTTADNGYFRVTAATGTTVTIAGGMTVDAAGDSVTIVGSTLRNGTVFQSFHVQKKLSSSMYLIYPGTFWTGGTLAASTGQFMTGTLTGISQNEDKSTSSVSTGSVVAAPTGRVNDNVAGFLTLELDGDPIDAVADSINIQIAKEGAAAQFGLGSSDAQGVLRGTLTVTGSIRIYFRTFALFDLYKAETAHVISFRTVDSTGAGYMVTLPAATLMNPQIVAGGPGQSVMAEFQLEGNPHSTLGYTIQLDKFAA